MISSGMYQNITVARVGVEGWTLMFYFFARPSILYATIIIYIIGFVQKTAACLCDFFFLDKIIGKDILEIPI